jgi:maleylacetate reductase
MTPFIYTGIARAGPVGSGTLSKLSTEIQRLGCSRAVLLSTPGRSEEIHNLAQQIDGLCAGVFAEARMHTPVAITEQALAAVRLWGGDCTVAFGGGSAIGLGKAIALRTDLPQIAIPTTYAGSEATQVLGETQHGKKTTQRSLAVLPEVILYDVDLTLSLPANITAVSGLNALAHSVEAVYGPDANPLTSTIAIEGIRTLKAALPDLMDNPGNRDARASALYGAWLSGVCLASVRMGLYHRLCHILGGTFNLPHAQTHAVLLPYAVAYNAEYIAHAMRALGRVLGASDVARSLFELRARLGAPPSLHQLGLSRDAIVCAADLALAEPYEGPRPLEMAAVVSLLEDAYQGWEPR